MTNNISFTKTCNFVSLLVKRENSLLVDVVGGGDHHVLEPLELELLPDPLHGLSDHSTKVSEISRINADPNSCRKLQ